jgi:hypothetical protein
VAAREEAASGGGGARGAGDGACDGAGRRWCAWWRRGVGAALVARGGAWGDAGVAGRHLDGEERRRVRPSAGSDGGERRRRGSE